MSKEIPWIPGEGFLGDRNASHLIKNQRRDNDERVSALKQKTPQLDKQWQESASFPTVSSFTIKLKGRDMVHRASGIDLQWKICLSKVEHGESLFHPMGVCIWRRSRWSCSQQEQTLMMLKSNHSPNVPFLLLFKNGSLPCGLITLI